MAEPINTNEQSDREFDLTIKLDERPPGGVSSVELIEGEPKKEPIVHMTQHEFDRLCFNAASAEGKVKKLEAQLAERTAQLKEVQANWKKHEPIVGRMEKAEARATAAKDACANLGAELAMATNALPARRVAALMEAFRKLEEAIA